MMSGSKAHDFDTYELFRATHSHNSPQYSHIVGLSFHFYAHIGAGPKVFHPPMSKLMWVKDLLTLVSLYDSCVHSQDKKVCMECCKRQVAFTNMAYGIDI